MTSDSIFTLKDNSPIPLEAILKTDLLRQGVAFSPEALQVCAAAKPKSYFIFSFNRVAQQELNEMERRAVPEEIALIGGPYNLKRTIVSVRVNPKSPYRINTIFSGSGRQGSSFSEPTVPSPQTPAMASLRSRSPHDKGSQCGGALRELPQKSEPNLPSIQLFWNGELISDIFLPKNPDYYEVKLSNGKPVTDIAPTIEWGYLIYLTAFRLCQYWGVEEECQFCDINNNYRQQKAAGRPYTGIKTPEEIVEALEIIHNNDPQQISHCYTVTGGSITTDLQGLNEAEFYAQYARAIEQKFPGRWIGKAVVQALPMTQVHLLKDAGYQIYHPNYEVWDKNLFAKLCPGKERSIGRDNWIKRILDAARIFGPDKVIPNFVAGIEMSQPYGFKTVDEAIESTTEGLDFFMSRGICPRFTVWCVEPNTVLEKSNPEPPSLEYYVRLLEVYREIFRKYRLPIPPGYGEAGLGKAVFSVSAFMDVL